MRFDLDAPDPSPAVIVAESRDTIVDAAVADGRLLVSSLRNACSRLAHWTLDGDDERAIALPGIGSLAGLAARWHDGRSFATFTSFTMPPTIMACDLGPAVSSPSERRRCRSTPRTTSPNRCGIPSKDGTPISMFLSHG